MPVYGITACPTNERRICQAAVWPNPGCRLIGRERGKLTCLHHPWLALRIALRQQALCRIGLHPRVAYRAFSPWLAPRPKPCVDARSRTISAKQAVDEQSQLVDAIGIEPSLHRMERSL